MSIDYNTIFIQSTTRFQIKQRGEHVDALGHLSTGQCVNSGSGCPDIGEGLVCIEGKSECVRKACSGEAVWAPCLAHLVTIKIYHAVMVICGGGVVVRLYMCVLWGYGVVRTICGSLRLSFVVVVVVVVDMGVGLLWTGWDY